MKAYKVIDTSGQIEYPEAAHRALDDLPIQIQTRRAQQPEELLSECIGADAIMVTTARVTRAVMQGLPELKAVIRYGVGMDRIDLQAAEELGVIAQNVHGFCTGEMADHCLGLILACARNLLGYVQATREGLWAQDIDRSLSRLQNATAGIVGLGAIGQALAKRLSALDMRLLYFDPYVEADEIGDVDIQPVELQRLLSESDFVSLHCPLSDETRHLIGPAELEIMKSSAFLINTSRGDVVEENALIEALREGSIAGAALDVLSTEPPPKDHPLLHMDQVLVTPHVAWYSEQAAEEVVVGAFKHLGRLLPQFTPGAPRK